MILQAVEGVVLLPENTDLTEIGVKSKDLHFVTAGSKGSAAKSPQTFNMWCFAVLGFVSRFKYKCLTCSPFLFLGVLRVWEAKTGRCVYTQSLPSTVTSASEGEEESDNPRSLTYLFHLPASSRLATVTAEHNILLYQLPALTTQQQVGTGVTR